LTVNIVNIKFSYWIIYRLLYVFKIKLFHCNFIILLCNNYINYQ